MNLLKITDAPIKPYTLLSKIAKKFNFETGIPLHNILEKKLETRLDFKSNSQEKKVFCSVQLLEYYNTPAFWYSYEGPTSKILTICDHSEAYFVPFFIDCQGKVHQNTLIAKNERGIRTAPDWFSEYFQ